MATFTAIRNKKQSAGAMRGVLDYVEKEEKVLRSHHRFSPSCNLDFSSVLRYCVACQQHAKI